ncbi:MAG TPA: FAD-dependent monooxygenase [Acidimicrobiales bacterium]|nr:FAD-dependent monooxygenase [Acidimicrobiales bacterium]
MHHDIDDTTARDQAAEVLPVVVVGGGPAGLAAAITLAGYGVDCLLVERRVEPSPLPRATGVSLRTMERLRAWGIEGAARAGGDDVEFRMRVCHTLAEVASGYAIDVGYPTRDQSLTASPVAPGCIPQDHLEAVLRAHLRTLPAARLRLGAAVEDVRLHADRAEVVLRDAGEAGTRTVAARYVVGADGPHSLVRDRLGIGTRASAPDRHALAVIARAPLWSLAGDHRYGLYAIEHPAGAGTFLPAGPPDRWLYGFEWDPTTERLADYPAGRLVDRIRAAAGDPDLPVQVEHVSSFSFTAAIADRFRHGRAFLAGDAAHRVTPRGGTGLNTAFADGFDLGWKLAWVLQGWAPAALLDTYEAERRPVAEHNVARSIDPEGSRRPAVDEMHVDLGGRISHLWLDGTPGAAPVSTLDLVGPGLTLFTGPGVRAMGIGTGAAAPHPDAPVTTRTVDGRVARGLGIPPGGGLLVRPDGVPVSAWSRPAHRRRGRSRPVRTAAGASR